jgi:acyl-CoA thioester hydrolase
VPEVWYVPQPEHRMGTMDAIDSSKASTSIPLRVRFCETDLMGIVHHGSYLLYFEAGRVEWLRARGVTYADWAAKGVHLPVVDAQIAYRAPSRFDDLLTVQTTLTKLGTVSLTFTYRVTRDATVIAEGSTRLGCIDADHKLMKIPEHMRRVLMDGEI